MLLDLNVSSTSRLGLEPIKDGKGGYLYNGCIPTRITDFHIGAQKHTKGEFKDMDVPVLQIEFENLKLNASDPDRFYTHSFKIVGTKKLVDGTTDQYENREALDINNDTTDLWKGIKHFLENLTSSPNYRNIANIPKTDFTAYFDLPGADAPDKRIAGYTAFFEYLVKFVNGDGKEVKSQIIGADGKALPLWVKMLPNYDRDPKRANKYFAISRFINQGVFEPLKLDKDIPVAPKIIRVKPTESLELISNATLPSGGGSNFAMSQVPGGAQGVSPEVAALLGGQ